MSETKQAYCMKCKAKRDMVNPVATFSTNGTPMTRGQCAVCGGNLSVMGYTAAHEGLEKPAVAPRQNTTKKSKVAPKASKTSSAKSKSASKPKSAASKATKSAADKKPTNSPKIKKLVIVESPAKARTVGNFLGSEYTVMASKGHIRDLLVSQLSVDVQNDFEPKYRVPNEKRETVAELKRAAANADVVYLATDPDREGEAIAWHLMAAADIPPSRTQRVVFHEITRSAVADAFAHPRQIDQGLVDAQQARRILDRLVGYNITELLWEKVRNRLSAGRVQSIALRMVVDREREIESFVREEYWTIDADLLKQKDSPQNLFRARLIRIHEAEPALKSEADVQPHVAALQASQYVVSDYKTGTRLRRPSAPFTTSTLQQEASRRLGFSATRTMKTAQDLYEGVELANGEVIGLITYMRTDSPSVSVDAQQEVRAYILQRFGQEFAPPEPPVYKAKAKGAQEAHEAIRPTSVLRHPDDVKKYLTTDQFRLYKLIWERFVASQMSPAVYDTVRVEIAAGPTNSQPPYLLRSAGSRVKFPGFLALYEDSRDEDAAADEDENRYLPPMKVGEVLQLVEVIPQQHFTEPPPRYTEASLVRALEEYGIGRPSTYAPTVGVIQDRDYVIKQDKRLVPTEIGKIVSDLLVQFFPEEMDYQFTARMEENLDKIAEGHIDWKPVMRQFYGPFEQRLIRARSKMPRMKQEELIGRKCPTCTTGDLVIKYGRRGKFIGCTNYPECKHTEPYLEFTGIACPQCGAEHGGQLIERKTKRGRTFYGCSRYPQCDYATWKLPSQTGGNGQTSNEERIELLS